jgi:ABC-type lipoprotein release transport system permease subunit
MKDLNNQMVYMSILTAQTLFSTEQQLTSWVLSVHNLKELDETVASLATAYGDDVSVRDWRDLAPEVEQSIQLDRVSGLLMMYLLYIVVGFGLFATLIMMTLERQREFSVMLATGMSRSVLLRLLAIESFFISILGVLLGFIFAIPLLLYYFLNPIQLTGEVAKTMLDMGYEPIIPVSLAPSIFIDQLLIILAMLVICLIYPMWRVLKLQVISGLKGVAHAS